MTTWTFSFQAIADDAICAIDVSKYSFRIINSG